MGILKMVAIPVGVTVAIPVVSIGLMKYNVEKYMTEEGIYDSYLLQETEGIDPKGEMYRGVFESLDSVLDGDANELNGAINEKYLNTIIYENTIKDGLGADYSNGDKSVKLAEGLNLYGYWVEFDKDTIGLNLGVGAVIPNVGEFQTRIQIKLKIVDNVENGYYELSLKDIKIGRLGLPGGIAGNIINLITEKSGVGSLDEIVNDIVGDVGVFDSSSMSIKVNKSTLVNLGGDVNAAMGEMVNVLFSEGLINLSVREEEITLNIDTERVLITDDSEEFINFNSVDLDGDGTEANNTDLSVTALMGYDVAAQGEKTVSKFMMNQLNGLDYVDITEVELNNMVNGPLNELRVDSVMSISDGTNIVDYYFGAGGVVVDLGENDSTLTAKTVINIGKLGYTDSEGNYVTDKRMAQIQVKAVGTVDTNEDGDLEVIISENGLGFVAPDGVDPISIDENLIGTFISTEGVLTAENNIIKVTLDALSASMFGEEGQDVPTIDSIAVIGGKFRLGLNVPENEALDNLMNDVTDNVTSMDEATKDEIFGDNNDARDAYDSFANSLETGEPLTEQEMEDMYSSITNLDQDSQSKLIDEMLKGLDEDDLAAIFGIK